MEHKDKAFIYKTVMLDGNSFNKCVFINCSLKYSGGKIPEISGCSLENTTFEFSDQAADTISFMKAMYGGGFHEIIEQTFTNIRKGQ